MILRRLTQSLKEQNWIAIGIELVIVFVGVFLGMQVTNWNEDRETRHKAALFTARLSEDLRKEGWGYEYLSAYSIDLNKNQRQVLDALTGELPLSDEQFLISAYRATQYKFNDRFRAAYDELVSTGNMGLIANQQLRETAVTVFTTTLLQVISDEGVHSEYRQLFRETVPADPQATLLTRCGDRYVEVGDFTGIRGSIDYPCTLAVAPEKIAAAAAALKSLPRLEPALRIRFADTQTALTDLQVSNKVVWTHLRELRGATP